MDSNNPLPPPPPILIFLILNHSKLHLSPAVHLAAQYD